MDLSPDEDHFQGRLLHQAALWDNVELLQELLANGAHVDARDGNGRTALHAASLCERSRCLSALCDARAALDARSDAATGGKTALHIAAERGHVENVRTLIDAGAALHLTDEGGDTPLALAEKNSHRHAASALREARDALERERLSAHAQLRELVTRGEINQLRAKLQALGSTAEIITNLTPNGANTLLYVASEAGLTSLVAALLGAGADGRAHPVTKYSPLYIAAYHGHVEIAKLLLAQFPHAVQQETVEKWLPLHAACIGGHAALVKLLLEYPYPEALLSAYTDPTGVWQYRAAFDANARDASGQTALYVACALGHAAVVDALLAHTVPCAPVHDHQPEEPPPAPPPAGILSPHRAGISLGIHAIVSKLTGHANKEPPVENVHRVRAVRVEEHRAGAGGGVDSCLAAAVRGGHGAVVARLLAAGASPDAPAAPPASDNEARARSRSAPPRAAPRPASPASAGSHNADRRGAGEAEGWTALALAARLGHMALAETLVRHGAADPHCRALAECARRGRADLLAALLATKAYPDPDYKLNKSVLSESVFSSRAGGGAGGGASGGAEGDTALTFSALCPTTPVMVNWSGLRCHLPQIRMCWLRSAALRVNSRLAGAGGAGGAAHALTRLDLSNNDLRALPPELFTLLSLRYLNAAQNKLERLPSPSDPFEDELDSKGRRSKRAKKGRPEVYSAPVLQEIYLQDNRLEELPPALFGLRSLSTLDVSNNKLRALPAAVWTAPALQHLNAALNHLRDLPLHESDCDTGSLSGVSSPVGAEPHSETPSRQGSQSKSVSRSPSIEHSESEPVDESIPVMGDRAGNAVWSAAIRAHPWRGVAEGCAGGAAESAVVAGGAGGSALTSLNLSHNQLTCVPAALACLAPQLTRLNLAYNSLRSMSYVTSYPTSLRQLDLSHNEITCWPSLPQVESLGSLEGDPLACYCGRGGRAKSASGGGARGAGAGSARAQLLAAACPARRHLRLEGLRTLILANNLLTRIQLTTDDDGAAPPVPTTTADPAADDDDDWCAGGGARSRLVFPLLSMLDVSCNLLRALPANIHELTNLAVLNISGNKDITELPPTMGLLSRLWNLSAAGCSLHEPLRSMLSAPAASQAKYRSMDVVSYLKSVLQEAKPYARMKLMLCGLQGIGKTSLLECLRQESSLQHRRKPTEHWAKRMGSMARRGGNVSTVGVDIGTWTYEKQRSTRGPVTFRTWDFGGQQEYYATHQYFLSRRSLYLVLWRVTDGRRGLAAAVDWLRSIQARAPGSPVIMVATHYDQVAHCDLPESESPEALQRLIRSSIMGAADADKLGLPKVLDSLEVSCSTRHNIRLLADIIYSVAFSVKPPGSKEPLLEQRVPASYLALEECVTSLAAELPEPVPRHHDYKRLVTQYMIQKNHRLFRDAAELHQATMFLHENGVLLHYDDATLKELYFLRPQWLCDVLAHVVTVREINPFATNGIMKVEDLAHVFKASPQLLRGEEAGPLGVSLLNKFELALCWDGRVLLVPPLLPPAEPLAPQLPLQPRSWAARGLPHRWPLAAGAPAPCQDSRGTDSPTLVQEGCTKVLVSGRGGARAALRRLLLLSYVPCGFWPRLVTRVLADASVRHAAQGLYTPPSEMELDEPVSRALELGWGWRLWRRGLRLACGDLTLLVVRELPARRDALLGALPGEPADNDDDCVYRDLRLRVKQEGVWCSLDVQASSCVEILLPSEVCCVRNADHSPLGRYQSISLEPNQETLAKVLALVADHVDLLLEDWYPSLGTRFVHTSEGRCLITRVVPCPACLRDLHAPPPADHAPPADIHHAAQAFRRLELAGAGVEGGEGRRRGGRARLSEESRTSDADSGVDAESNASSRVGSVEGVCADGARVAFGWSVEECILCACTGAALHCAHHTAALRDVAPDTLLLDVSEDLRVRWEQVVSRAVCGRGAFGTVLGGEWRRAGGTLRVAIKALQPVPPPPACDTAALHAYKAALSRWERDPCAAACRAYCGLRQELGVLARVRHAHVVPLLGVCAAPLALLLPLAPLLLCVRAHWTARCAGTGAVVRGWGCGLRVRWRCRLRARLSTCTRGASSTGTSSRRTCWCGPCRGRRTQPQPSAVRPAYKCTSNWPTTASAGWPRRRALRGSAAPRASWRPRSCGTTARRSTTKRWTVSRTACCCMRSSLYGSHSRVTRQSRRPCWRAPGPRSTPGQGGRAGGRQARARHQGTNITNSSHITDSSRCVEGHKAVKEAVLEGARPALDTRDLQWGCCVLECMRRCWAAAPELRPSAAALVCVCAAPEFAALQDAARARPPALCAAATALRNVDGEGGSGWEVWYAGEAGRAHALSATRHAFTSHHSIRVSPDDDGEPVTVTAMCAVGPFMWLGDSAGRISAYSISTCALSWSVSLREAVGGAGGVAALLPLPLLQRVAVALRCGRLFLVSEAGGAAGAEAEASFVLTELGAATSLRCLAAVDTPHGLEVWAGGDDLYAYTLRAGGVSAADTLQAPAVTLLAAPAAAARAPAAAEPYVVAYSEPGVSVVQWSARSRRQAARLDCSKLAPCSESLQSIAIDEHLAEDRCKVTALCCAGGAVYVGTAWGCLIVCDASLRPLTVFRPVEEQLCAIVPLLGGGAEGGEAMLATLGGGYRPLLSRFAPPQANNRDSMHGGAHCLLWRTSRWLPD